MLHSAGPATFLTGCGTFRSWSRVRPEQTALRSGLFRAHSGARMPLMGAQVTLSELRVRWHMHASSGAGDLLSSFLKLSPALFVLSGTRGWPRARNSGPKGLPLPTGARLLNI